MKPNGWHRILKTTPHNHRGQRQGQQCRTREPTHPHTHTPTHAHTHTRIRIRTQCWPRHGRWGGRPPCSRGPRVLTCGRGVPRWVGRWMGPRCHPHLSWLQRTPGSTAAQHRPRTRTRGRPVYGRVWWWKGGGRVVVEVMAVVGKREGGGGSASWRAPMLCRKELMHWYRKE